MSYTPLTDPQHEAIWDSFWGYHGREPMKLGTLEYGKAVEAAATEPLLARIAALEAELAEASKNNDALLEALKGYVTAISTAGGGDKALFMAAIREADNAARAAIDAMKGMK